MEGLSLLHYADQRQLVRAYAECGNTISVRRTSHGNVRIRMGQPERDLCIRDAMERLDTYFTMYQLWPEVFKTSDRP